VEVSLHYVHYECLRDFSERPASFGRDVGGDFLVDVQACECARNRQQRLGSQRCERHFELGLSVIALEDRLLGREAAHLARRFGGTAEQG
jgi:hypothetical protein